MRHNRPRPRMTKDVSPSCKSAGPICKARLRCRAASADFHRAQNLHSGRPGNAQAPQTPRFARKLQLAQKQAEACVEANLPLRDALTK